MKRLLLTALLIVTSCSVPSPIPTPPPDVPDAAPITGDVFTGKIFRCATVESNPVDSVRTCLDVENTSSCLIGLADPFGAKDSTNPVVTAVACTVRLLEMDLYPGIAKGTATDAQRRQAEAASRFINEHGMGFYAE